MEHEEALLKYPKNIRQIGEIGEGKRIYLEDYVMTYTTHLAGEVKEGYACAVLLGQKAVVEGRRTIFISGAVELVQDWQKPAAITGEQWKEVYDQMQQYFHHVEVLGWFVTHPGLELEVNEQIRCVWHSGFEGEDRILFLYDNISREEAFYTYKDGEFLRQTGYYIYYEKNEQMQEYMVDRKGGKSIDEEYRDKASGKIRKKIEKKNQEHKKYLFQQQIIYSVGIVAGAIVLVMAASRLQKSAIEEMGAEAAAQGQNWLLEGSKEEVSESKAVMKETNVQAEETKMMIAQEKTSQETDSKKEKSEKQKSKLEEEKESEKEDNSQKKEENQKEVSEEKYTVKKGDTLESISIAYYGTSRYVKKIKKCNQLENADKIYIGQELILP